MMVYAWFVWEKGYSDEPTISWIDNNDDVLSKKDRHYTNCHRRNTIVQIIGIIKLLIRKK